MNHQVLAEHARRAGQRMNNANLPNLGTHVASKGACMAACATLLSLMADNAENHGAISAAELLAMHQAFCDAAGIELTQDAMGCPVYMLK